jgi:hypothetical protein
MLNYVYMYIVQQCARTGTYVDSGTFARCTLYNTLSVNN